VPSPPSTEAKVCVWTKPSGSQSLLHSNVTHTLYLCSLSQTNVTPHTYKHFLLCRLVTTSFWKLVVQLSPCGNENNYHRTLIVHPPISYFIAHIPNIQNITSFAPSVCIGHLSWSSKGEEAEHEKRNRFLDIIDAWLHFRDHCDYFPFRMSVQWFGEKVEEKANGDLHIAKRPLLNTAPFCWVQVRDWIVGIDCVCI